MKNITIEKLILTNFKSVKKLTINFKPDRTIISGDNGTGKTTVFDAVAWLLFGKDSLGQSNFEIKRKHSAPEGNQMPNAEVEGIIGGVNFRKIYAEKWVTRRGSVEPIFSGHEVEYFVNDVPVAMTEYNNRVEQLISADIFPLITSPTAFTGLHWTKQRELLFEMSGNPKPMGFDDLFARLGDLTFAERKAQINRTMLALKEEAVQIPARIDELKRSMPDAEDIEPIHAQLTILNARRADLIEQSRHTDKRYEAVGIEINAIQDKIQAIHNERQDAVNKHAEAQGVLAREHLAGKQELENQLRSLESKRRNIQQDIERKQGSIDSANQQIKQQESDLITFNAQRVSLLADWAAVNDRVITVDKHALTCPTCGQGLPEFDADVKVLELTAKANEAKQSELRDIERRGAALKQRRENTETDIERLKTLVIENESEKANLEIELSELPADNYPRTGIAAYPEFQRAPMPEMDMSEIEAYQATIAEMRARRESDKEGIEIAAKIGKIDPQIESLQTTLREQKQREQALTRIAELEARSKAIGQEMSILDRDLNDMKAYDRAKVDLVTDKINSLFATINFKLFEIQINGGEKAVCEATINGVPFSSANHAARINAGLEIVTAISNYKRVTAPVFIDNAEAVNEILQTPGQMILLSVSKENSLTIK